MKLTMRRKTIWKSISDSRRGSSACLDIQSRFQNVSAIILLKAPAKGMKVLIDGRTFVDYAQFGSGIAVPGYVAREAGMPFKTYTAHDSMILNFA